MLRDLPMDIRKHITSFLKETCTLTFKSEGKTFQQELFRYHASCYYMLLFCQPRTVTKRVFNVFPDALLLGVPVVERS